MPKITTKKSPSPQKTVDPTSRPKVVPKKSFVSFIDKLRDMVDDVNIETIGWNKEGDGIRITNTTDLCNDVFPSYFKHACWASFTRQLNLYGFVRYSHGLTDDHSLIYKHEYFVKGRRDLLKKIHRRVSNSKHEAEYEKSSPQVDEPPNHMVYFQNRVNELSNECSYLRNELAYLRDANYSLNQSLKTNNSTLRYVMTLLNRAQSGSLASSPELNLAIQALEYVAKQDNTAPSVSVPINQGYLHDITPEETSSPVDVCLNPIKGSRSDSKDVKLPSIKFLLR